MLGTATPGALTFAQLRTAPDLVIENYINANLWFRTRNRYPFTALLEMLSSQARWNSEDKGKQPSVFVGDEEPTSVEVATAFAYNGTTIILGPAYNWFQPGTVLHLFDSAQNSGDGGFAQVRLTSTATASGSDWSYSCVVDATDTTAGTFATATTAGNVVISLMTWDGEAGDFSQRRPDSVSNYAQRSREVIGEGEWQMAENFFADMSIMRQAQDKMYNVLTKLDKHYLTAPRKGLLTIDGKDAGMAGGLQWWLQPHNTSPVAGDAAPLTGVRGVIRVLSSSSITYNDINDMMADTTEFGGDFKIIVAKPAMLVKAKRALREATGMSYESIKYQFPGTEMVWEMEAVTLDVGKVAFLPDKALNTVKMTVTGDDFAGAETTSVSGNFLYFIDPEHIGVKYLKTSQGSQRVALYDVPVTNRNSVIKKEIDYTGCVMVTEIRAHGVLALDGA